MKYISKWSLLKQTTQVLMVNYSNFDKNSIVKVLSSLLNKHLTVYT